MPNIFILIEDEKDMETFEARFDRDKLLSNPVERMFFANKLSRLGKRLIDKLKQEKRALKKKGE